ncbi:MAG: DUF6266 family protein [Daejeonella sp.]
MARQIGLGRISGKVGDRVFSSYKGQDYVKSAPKKSTKAKSEKQLAQQVKFALATRFLHPLYSEVNIWLKQKHRAASGYNMAIKHMIQNVIKGEYPDFSFDYSMVQLSNGNWGTVVCCHLFPGAASLTVTWIGDLFQMNAYGDDKVHILIYEPESKTFLKGPGNVLRSHSACIMNIPSDYQGRPLHVYLVCISSSGKISKTLYGGEVSVDLIV